MSIIELLVLLVVAGLAGALGQTIAGYSHGGCLASIAVGFIGALLGSWMSRVLHLPDVLILQVGSQAYPLVWSVVGAALFVAVVGYFARPRPKVQAS